MFFLSVFAALAVGTAESRAELPKTGRPVTRSLVVWEQPVEYQFILKDNPRLPFDGEASRKQVKGQEVHFIVLNKAFFQREAKDLFERFEEGFASMEPSTPTREQLSRIEDLLIVLKNSPAEWNRPGQETISQTNGLKEYLEYLAWFPLYQTSIRENKSRRAAAHHFEKQFTQTRLETIEWHEAAHLADIKGVRDTKGEAFGRTTELNAFFAELTYGTNPHDVMAQVLAGLIDELRQGKSVDFSLQKVFTVVEFLKECPQFAKLRKPGSHPLPNKAPLPGTYLEILAQLKTSDFILVGRELYRKNLLASGQALASLP